MEKKVKAGFVMLLALALSVLPLVSSFGVSSPYWETNPMVTYPGASETVNLNLQNMAGATESVVANVVILNGSEIASIGASRYTIEANTLQDVPIQIRIPSDTPIGTVFKVRLSTQTVAAGGDGQITMGTGMMTIFEVRVGEKPAGVGPNYLLYGAVAVGAVIVLIILVRLLKRKPKKK